MSKTLTNGSSNRLPSIDQTEPARGSLPVWPNRETALVFTEILYACVLNEDDKGVISADLAIDAYARRLKKHFNADHWVYGPSDLTGLRITSAAFDLLLSRVDWKAVAEHLQAFSKLTVD